MNVAKQLGDFPVTRKNLQAAYQLAVVVDDHEMSVNEVVRGDDLLASAFRQADLIHALDLRCPAYVHVPLVIGNDGRRLAKRHGDTRLSQYRDQGIKPEQVVGWAAKSANLILEERPLMPRDLLSTFNWESLPPNPVVKPKM